MPGTRSHESPPSWLLNKDAGSTPHHRSFFPPPASSDQMLMSARPSSLENAGADFVSLKLFPRSVERSTFIPKNGLQLEAYRRGVPRVSISVEYTGTPGPEGPRSPKLRLGAAASATNTPFLVPMVRMTRSAIFNLPRPPAGWLPRPPASASYRPRRVRAHFPSSRIRSGAGAPRPFRHRHCGTTWTGSAPDPQAPHARSGPRWTVAPRPHSTCAAGPEHGS